MATDAQVAGFRLERSLLARRSKGSLPEVAGAICGLHAQVLSSADLSTWARANAHRPDDLARALWDERTLVKTWLMRGTLHLVPADDLPLYCAAVDLAEYPPAWLRWYEVTPTKLERLINTIADILDGRALTRKELTAEIRGRLGRSFASRLDSGWGSLLKPAARRGCLCFGPSQGQNVTFVRPDQWLGRWRDVEKPAAQTELLRRYLAAYGPASQADFARWLGLASARRVREAWSAVETAEVAPKRFVLEADLPALEAARPGRSVRLLPAFDPFLLAHRDRTHAVPPEHGDRVYRTAGWVSAVVLERGRVVGVWRHERRRRRVEVAVEPFRRLSKGTRSAVAREADALARYLGGELALTL